MKLSKGAGVAGDDPPTLNEESEHFLEKLHRFAPEQCSISVLNMAKLPETEATNGETYSKDSFEHIWSVEIGSLGMK
ncbi:hypothetical protein WN944_010514 [Citrus x changshan-huyou]|uniref:Uncharacterized protein n=1 Tax=Citrus x changshan-huyou TaxID=2935761 RepID=A0AAP0MRS8_9ROSI